VQHVSDLAGMAPEEIAELVDFGDAGKLLDIKELNKGLKSLLRPWTSISRASPRLLTDQQYKRFLEGLDPIDDQPEDFEV
jgi:hypothetical protein